MYDLKCRGYNFCWTVNLSKEYTKHVVYGNKCIWCYDNRFPIDFLPPMALNLVSAFQYALVFHLDAPFEIHIGYNWNSKWHNSTWKITTLSIELLRHIIQEVMLHKDRSYNFNHVSIWQLVAPIGPSKPEYHYFVSFLGRAWFGPVGVGLVILNCTAILML